MIQYAREKEINRNNKNEEKMISYKLKHLCSRVIASLSAFGLIQITSGKSHAYTLDNQFRNAMPGDTFVYNTSQYTTFNAEYSSHSGCAYGTADNNLGIMQGSGDNLPPEYHSAVTGADGDITTTGYCKFACAPGYSFADGSNTKFIGFSTTNGLVYLDETCTKNELKCEVSSEFAATISHGSGRNVMVGAGTGSGLICDWYCKDGYSVDGGKNTTSSYSGGTVNGNTLYDNGYTGKSIAFPTKNCKPRSFTLNFNCAPGHFVESETATTSGYAVTYGQTVTIPDWASCDYAGHDFDGWSGNAH